MGRRFGIDRPWYRQYASYLESVVRFDFGNTFSYRYLTVNSVIERQGKILLMVDAREDQVEKIQKVVKAECPEIEFAGREPNAPIIPP